jgi:hypothetical protein
VVCFLGFGWLPLVGVVAGIALITQRSVVQIHPPQPNKLLHCKPLRLQREGFFF